MLVQAWLSALQYGLKVMFIIGLSFLQMAALGQKQPLKSLAAERLVTAISGRSTLPLSKETTYKSQKNKCTADNC